MAMLVSQLPARRDDAIITGTERKAWLQNQRDAADGDVDSARRAYSSMRSPKIGPRCGTGRKYSRSQQAKAGGEERFILPPGGRLIPSCFGSFVLIPEALVFPRPATETAFLPALRAPASVPLSTN